MRKHPLRLMIATMVVAYGLLLITVVSGKSPTLGLDLQGGVSVNLQPVKDGKVTDDVSSETLDQAIGIIRKRVDALGVAEPEVSRQGNNILIQLPGRQGPAGGAAGPGQDRRAALPARAAGGGYRPHR